MSARWDHSPRDRERMAIHASPQALAALLEESRAEHRRVGRVIDWLEQLHAQRAAEKQAGTWPYAKDPRAVQFPCGKSHVCTSCSPVPDVPGSGCHNCRATGYDQTPCLPCAAVELADKPPRGSA